MYTSVLYGTCINFIFREKIPNFLESFFMLNFLFLNFQYLFSKISKLPEEKNKYKFKLLHLL